MFTQEQKGASETVGESEAAKAARAEAVQRAKRRAARCGYAWHLPSWYEIDRVQGGELPGSLHEERVRCGKEGCRCQSGRKEDLHGPYHYRRWRDEDGRHRKAYVRKQDLPAVRAKVERRRRRVKIEREARRRHMRRGKYAWGSWRFLHLRKHTTKCPGVSTVPTQKKSDESGGSRKP